MRGIIPSVACATLLTFAASAFSRDDVTVGAAAVELFADDSMEIGGGIHPWKANGQEGKLRAVAVVVGGPEKPGANAAPVALVACDILMIERDILDEAARRIESEAGIPASHVLINATHTHSAPTTCTVHGYKRDETFARRVLQGVVEAVGKAEKRRKEARPASLFFQVGQEASVGQNSRLLLSDGTVFWVGPRDDAVRPTGPFDPELPVLSFRGSGGRPIATIFNHSTHTIGTIAPGKRSPSFYGLAAQELETELGGTVLFLEGASGSTHNLVLAAAEAALRIQNAVRDAHETARPMPVDGVDAIKEELPVRVRTFDELKEDEAVRSYCAKRIADKMAAESVAQVFRDMRRVLAPKQGAVRKTWVQSVRIGDVAIVGVPGECFTLLGLEIKRQSPFRYTYVAELANDWVGYLPDRKAFDLGGYQTWTGLHSYTAPGTGEAIVAAAVDQLQRLAARRTTREAAAR